MTRTETAAYAAALVACVAWLGTLAFATTHIFGALAGMWAAPHPTAAVASISAVVFWVAIAMSAFAASRSSAMDV